MTHERPTPDIEDMIKRYLDGQTCAQIAEDIGWSKAYVRKKLAAHIRMRPPSTPLRNPVDDSAVVAAYSAGASELEVSRTFGISRPAVRRRLLAAGVTIRGGSEANRVSMARMGLDQRRARARAANRAVRLDDAVTDKGRGELGMRRSAAVAETRTREIGKGEAELLDILIGRGFAVEPQLPVYGYNLDLAVRPVAVEIWWGHGYPLRLGRHVRKTVDLADLGWWTIWVWCSGVTPDDACADQIVALLNAAERHPSARGEYRVIRSTGEHVAGGPAYLDQITLEPS